MNSYHLSSLIIGMALLTCQSYAQVPNDEEQEGLLDGLAGRIFAVEAEIVFSADGESTGLQFENCYFFLDDNVWIDPLFPAFDGGAAGLPGQWIQHTELPMIEYNVLVDGSTVGLPSLTQRGTVTPGRGEGDGHLIAYTTAWASGAPVVDVVSRGREVSEEEASAICPGVLPLPI